MAEVTLKVAASLVNRSPAHVRRLLLEGKLKGRQVEDVHGPAWRVDTDSLHAHFAPGWPQNSRAAEIQQLRKDVQMLTQVVLELQHRIAQMT